MYRDMNKVGRPCIDECSCGCYDNKAGYLGTSPLEDGNISSLLLVVFGLNKGTNILLTLSLS